MIRLCKILFVVLFGLIFFAEAEGADYSERTDRVSVNFLGVEGNGASDFSSISEDGRFVAFYSDAANLVPGDTNGSTDIFVHDRVTGITMRASVDSSGVQANDWNLSPAISASGQVVAFESGASNLVAGDNNNFGDIFARDFPSGTTIRVSVDTFGGDANHWSFNPAISQDGLFVAFSSNASNLVAADTNGDRDIFARDLQNGTTTRVSVSSSEVEANGGSFEPSVSQDGLFVAFSSNASNLVADDTNTVRDIFVRDLQNGTTTRVSVSSSEVEANNGSFYASVSQDGRFVAFSSDASNLVADDTNEVRDIFVRDLQNGTTTRVSEGSSGVEGNGPSGFPSISPDGRIVAFESAASNLIPGDFNLFDDIFVHDRQLGTTTLASVGFSGGQVNDGSYFPSISARGHHVAFTSPASNLVSADTNNEGDIFVYDFQGPDIPIQTDELAVAFPGFGLWHFAQGIWTLLSGADADAVENLCGDLAANFPSSSLYIYDGNWTRISSANAENIIAYCPFLFADFGPHGLWVYNYYLETWVLISSADPESMALYNGTLVCDFGASGLFEFDGYWTRTSSADAGVMTGVDIND